MSHTFIVAGNWKMQKTQAECAEFFQTLSKEKISNPKLKSIVAVSPTLMASAKNAALAAGVEVYSQNCHWENSGAFTGEISPTQLVDLGITGTLVGHSERRQYFADTDETVSKRALAALKAGLKVIYCIGESLAERQSNSTHKVLETQINAALDRLCPAMDNNILKSHLIWAYEPVWAIGTGLTAGPEQIADAHGHIQQLQMKRGLDLAILYGGSVKPDNFKDILGVKYVSGGLVGGASLKPNDYIALQKAAL